MKVHTTEGLQEEIIESQVELRYDEVSRGYWITAKLPDKQVDIFLPDGPFNSTDRYFIKISSDHLAQDRNGG